MRPSTACDLRPNGSTRSPRHGTDRRVARSDRRSDSNRPIAPTACELKRFRVPLGVVFFIYESRPNVTADAAAICVKSGNAVILRGGKEASHSSAAIVDTACATRPTEHGLPADAVQLVEHDRSRRRRASSSASPSTSMWPFRAAAKA